jgi:dephospho-CoA kinase
MSRLIGITGGIGCGKSYISRTLRLLGLEVYDCDLEAKRLMDTDPVISAELRSYFGPQIFQISGAIDRGELAKRVFANDADRLWLNSLVHGAVRQDVVRWRSEHRQCNLLFIESAILATSNLTAYCDEVWQVTAPMETRIARVEARNGWQRDQILSRIKSQETEAEMLLKYAADHDMKVVEIVNDGNEPVLGNLKQLLNNLEN